MLIRMRKATLLINAFLFAAAIITAQFPARKALAAAPGCPSSHPTAITGSITSYGGNYHGWSVNALIGMDFHNSASQKVDINGNIKTSGGYSYFDHVNPSLAPPGVSSGQDRSFGEKVTDGNGILCVAANIKVVWFEIYPKNSSGTTTKTYHGGANDQRMSVTTGATNSFGLRIPTGSAFGGNTGDVNGYIRRNGSPIATNNLSLRAWPTVRGSSCGVQGFSAGADSLGISTTQNGTYYLIKHLAGGQCGAKSQKYRIVITCKNVCGSSSVSQTKYVNITKGKRPRIDFGF